MQKVSAMIIGILLISASVFSQSENTTDIGMPKLKSSGNSSFTGFHLGEDYGTGGFKFMPDAGRSFKNYLLNSSLLNSEKSTEFNHIRENFSAEKPKKKKIWLGVLLSALLPGAGEFYGEDYLKASIFFGVEVLAWGSFAYFTVKGDDKTNEFQDYANQKWNVRQYAQWLVDEWQAGNINPNEPDLEVLRAQINEFESDPQGGNFSHSLPAYNSQQYYEVIGKYQNYVAGWADARTPSGWIVTKANYINTKTAMFNSYAEDRQKANDFYYYAKWGVFAVILNHIISAADAALTISVYNKKINIQTGMEIQRYISPTGGFGYQPAVKLKVNF